MQRRKFIVGLGSLAAGGSALLGTGAFEGAYVNGDRDFNMAVTTDNAAILGLIDKSKFASYKRYDQYSSFENKNNAGLAVEVTNLNTDMDTRLDEVFCVRNNSGEEWVLKVEDSGASGTEHEDAFQVWGQPSSGSPVRLDDGGSITMGAGEEIEINLFFLLGTYGIDNGQVPTKLTFTADGVDSNA